MSAPHEIERYQWMASSAQPFGNRTEIRSLSQRGFTIYLAQLVGTSYRHYLNEYPDITHYKVFRRHDHSEWMFDGVGPLDDLRPHWPDSRYAKRVKAFNTLEALQWGRTKSEDYYDPSSLREKMVQAYIATLHPLLRRFYL